MRNFRVNEQESHRFNMWLLTRYEGCIEWIAKIARDYFRMMNDLKEMNE